MIRVIIFSCAFAVTLCKVITVEETPTVSSVEQEDSTAEFTTSEYPATLENFGNHSESFEIPHATEISQRSRRSNLGSNDGGCPNGWFRAIIQQYPFVVALYDSAGDYLCVGTTLTPRLILTANHCISPEYNRAHSIRANSDDNLNGGEKIWIHSVIRYPGADTVEGNPHPHDIGLVLLKQRISNPSIVPLIDSSTLLYGESIVIAVGWGKTRYKDDPRQMHATALQLHPISECQKKYGDGHWICTDSTRTSTCVGDSGGPIMYNGVQAGIVSHSIHQQCGSGEPTANVNVKKYLGWIRKHVNMYQ